MYFDSVTIVLYAIVMIGCFAGGIAIYNLKQQQILLRRKQSQDAVFLALKIAETLLILNRKIARTNKSKENRKRKARK